MLTRTTRTSLTAATAALALAVMVDSAQGAIIKVNAGSHTQPGTVVDGTAGGPYNITINAGASDYLIVGVSNELGGTSAYTASFDGNDMTRVTDIGSLNQNKIFVLDLTETTYTGGNATLSFTWTATGGGDLGVGWVSLDEGTLGPGEYLGVVAKADSSGVTGSTVNLTTTTDGTFNFANWYHNKGTNGVLSSNLTQIYRNADFGSMGGAAGYEQGATAGTHTYSWAATSPGIGAAVAIGVVPEPASLALGLMGLTMIAGRRRR